MKRLFCGPSLKFKRMLKLVITQNSITFFICELVEIGNNCFIGHGVMFINDKFKFENRIRHNKKLWLNQKLIPISFYRKCHPTILPVSICSNVVVGAGSVVTKILQNLKICFIIQQKIK